MGPADNLSGLIGVAARVINALGELGVGLLTFVETVFPPVPSEVILPLAGFLAHQGELDFVFVVVAATMGGYLGAVLLYALGARVGQERVIATLSRLPLLDRDDFEGATGWFNRHGRRSVFFGRLIPGVRSLISLPAGAGKMPFLTFSVFTIAGTLVWNLLLVGLGSLLGTQYALVDKYSHWLDYLIYAVIAVFIAWLVRRRILRNRRSARTIAAQGQPPR